VQQRSAVLETSLIPPIRNMTIHNIGWPGFLEVEDPIHEITTRADFPPVGGSHNCTCASRCSTVDLHERYRRKPSLFDCFPLICSLMVCLVSTKQMLSSSFQFYDGRSVESQNLVVGFFYARAFSFFSMSSMTIECGRIGILFFRLFACALVPSDRTGERSWRIPTRDWWLLLHSRRCMQSQSRVLEIRSVRFLAWRFPILFHSHLINACVRFGVNGVTSPRC
jgi:hypothetical protein